MDAKKIKKSTVNLTSFVFGLILFLGIFTGMFLWLNKNVNDSGNTIDDKYTNAYNQLNSTQSELDDNIESIKESFTNIGEADNTWQVAWNGFKALGETMKLPINFIDTVLQELHITFIALDYVPEWFKTLAGMAITALVVFLVLALLKGESNM
jgi:hypothetical protein